MTIAVSKTAGACALAAALLCGASAPTQAASSPNACRSLTPAAIGGPLLPADRATIVLRWLGTSNYELAYKGNVYLLDTYYDRGVRNKPIGVTAAQVNKATAIFIGHGHFDHMSDSVPIAKRTGAPVIGAPVTIEAALKMGLPQSQAKPVSGGETLTFPGVTVTTALARHSSLSQDVLKQMGELYKLDAPPATPEQEAEEKAIREKGTFSPDVITKGTIAYAFSFDTGFKMVFIDSAGPVTDGDRELAAKLGPVDLAIVAYQGHPVAQTQMSFTLPLIELFKPRIYLPAHHDEIFGTFVDLGIEPLFMAIRDKLPGTRTVQPLYRTPICVDIGKRKKT